MTMNFPLGVVPPGDCGGNLNLGGVAEEGVRGSLP